MVDLWQFNPTLISFTNKPRKLRLNLENMKIKANSLKYFAEMRFMSGTTALFMNHGQLFINS